MSKFMNMANEKVIWSNISNLFVRKQDLVNQVEGILVYPESDTVDLSSKKDVKITQIEYEAFDTFVNKYASQKYINDQKLGLCPILCVFDTSNKTRADILEQTDSILVLYNEDMYLVQGIHYDKDEASGALGTYQLKQTPYLEKISAEYIESLPDPNS